MSEFKGTPWTAEWFEETCDWVVMGGIRDIGDGITGRSNICTLSDYGTREMANLIAAAPELLEACVDALDSMESAGVLVTGDMHKGDPAVEKLRAAIAKALGEGQ